MMMTVSIFSCTNDYDPGLIENLGIKEQPLRIITKVLTTKSPNFMQEFTKGSVIGLHVVSENTGNIYDSNPDYKNVRAEAYLVNNKLNWSQSPTVYLREEPVSVYAYYPYQSQVNFDPENIPVRISPDASLTKDYMYGIQASGQRAVNRISPVALLNMNHTLSLLSFQLRLTPETEGCFLLHAIQIGNKAGGTALCFRGRMNIKTGNYILWVSLLSLLIIILLHQSIIVIEDEEESKARLEIFQSPKGWGYQIIMGQKILIYQPTIPAIDTVMPFPDEISTRKIGILVLKRFNEHRNFSVSKEEVYQRLPSCYNVIVE